MKRLKVVLTGGPCGGKTTAIQSVEQEFSEKGYKVLVVPEAATILINSGIKPFGIDSMDVYEFQKCVMDLQYYLEKMAEQVADKSSMETIILCDRGLMDDKAYVSDVQFNQLLQERGITQFDVMNNYDLIIHLKTAAFGKEEFYTLENNQARTETVEEARERDKKTLEAWLGHDNLKIMGNDTDFETKINNSMREIYEMLKSPIPFQCQEKYLVDDVDFFKLLELQHVKLGIEQYILQDPNRDILYRKTERDGEVKYYAISKWNTDINSERIVKKKNISEQEYFDNMPDGCSVLRKTRYCFEYLEQYFRLDIFDNEPLKILEIEDTSETKKRQIPEFLVLLDDITDDVSYRNSSLYFKKNRDCIKVKRKV